MKFGIKKFISIFIAASVILTVGVIPAGISVSADTQIDSEHIGNMGYIDNTEYSESTDITVTAAEINEIINRSVIPDTAAEGDVSVSSVTGDTSWYNESGSEFVLTTGEQLSGLSELVNSGTDFSGKTVKLGNDITWIYDTKPIGNAADKTFNGVFDGCNHRINNMVMFSDNVTVSLAMFLYTGSGSEIKNLTVSGEVTGKKCGGIVGVNTGKISDVISEVNVIGDGQAGGICITNSGVISGCINRGMITNTYNESESAAGGITAANIGIITGCRNYGNINTADSLNSSNIGGVVGVNGSASSEAVLENSENNGSIFGRGMLGGVVGSSVNKVTNCVNIGIVSGSEQYVGGVIGKCTAEVNGCKNYGNVYNTGRTTGGVVSSVSAPLENCVNLGEIFGDINVGGICGYSDSTINLSVNRADVTAEKNSAGGISGGCRAVVITSCSNYGKILAYGNNIDPETDFENGNAGGILGNSTSMNSISMCANFGNITSLKANAGGIVGKQGAAGAKTLNCYSIADIDAPSACGSMIGYNNGQLRFSFSIGIPSDTAIGEKGANSYMGGMYKYVDFSSSELTNGTLLKNLNTGGGEWIQGGKYPAFVNTDDPIGLVNTEEELKAALSDINISIIKLGSDIDLLSDLTVSRPVTIDGSNCALKRASLNINAQNVILSNIVLCPVNIVGSVTFSGCVIADKDGISLNSGSLDISDCVLGVYEPEGFMIAAESGTDVEGAGQLVSTAVDGVTYYYLRSREPLWDNKTAVSITIPADFNNGLSYDLEPYFINGNVYFMMPAGVDLSNIAYVTKNTEGDVLDTKAFSSANNGNETMYIKGIKFTISALQAQIPTVYLNMDESKGTISDMHNSADHSKNCYGEVKIDVPQDIADKNGWQTEYNSSDVELRGRGNSSWAQGIREGKQRPYQFKLSKKLDIMNMGKAKSWTLLRAYNKYGYLNNKICYNFAEDIGIKYNSKAEFVNVYLNGKYIGLYTLAEKVQVNSSRVNITDMEDVIDEALNNGQSLDEIDKTGGYLLEIDNTYDTPRINTDNGSRVTIKSPETLDTLPPSDPNSRYKYINDLICDLFRAVYGDGYLSDGRHFTEVLDMDSVARYLLHQELVSNKDCCKGSTFLYKDTDSVDPTIYMGPVWDCDTALTSEFDTQWLLPDRLGYDDEILFCNALMDHREVMSYVVAYYKNKDINIPGIFKASAEKVKEYNNYCSDAMSMSNIVWKYGSNSDNSPIYNMILNKAAWVDQNIDDPSTGLMTLATKGQEIVVPSPKPSETPDISPTPDITATPKPTSEPIDENGLITYFKFENGTVGEDLPGNFEDGYDSRQGVESKLYASVDGQNYRKLKWSAAEYTDGGEANVCVPILEPNADIAPWGEKPYFMVKTSSKNYSGVTVSAKIGGTKKGAADFDIEYSADGVNFVKAFEGETISKNKKMVSVFDNVKLPADAGNQDNLYIKITPRDGVTIGGGVFVGTTGGEFAVNDIIVRGINGMILSADYSDGMLCYKLRNTTGIDISSVRVMAAVYSSDDTLSGFESEQKDSWLSEMEISGSLAVNADGKSLKLFVWNAETNEPLCGAETIK